MCSTPSSNGRCRRRPDASGPILLTGAAQLLSRHAAARRGRHGGGGRAAGPRRSPVRQAHQRGPAPCRRQGRSTAAGQGSRRAQYSGLAAASAGARPMATTSRGRSPKQACKEAPLDISLKPGADTQEWAERLGGQRAADRLDPARRARPHRGSAGLCRWRLVGAGRGRGAGRARGGRCRGAHGRRSVRRAGRQDGGAGCRRRPGHRGRRLAQTPGAPARESAAARDCRQRWLPPTRRAGRRSARSMPWFSMRPAPPRAPSAGIPTSCA